MSTADPKVMATIKARFALAGMQVYSVAEGGFIVVWRGNAREVLSLDELQALLKRIEPRRCHA